MTIDRVRELVETAERITVFTGAGISTDSGIPDFRGPNGLWTTNPLAEKASTLQHYLADASVRHHAWQNRVHSPAWRAQPNAGHFALVELERRGVLQALVTQNIDELHQRAGHDPAMVIEMHGTMWWSRCWTCGDRRPMREAVERVRAGDDDPHCLACAAAGRIDNGRIDNGRIDNGRIDNGRIDSGDDGVLKSDTISFGQALVPEVIEAAMAAADACDLLIAAGSSLSVFPAANVIPRAKAGGARVVIMNGQPTKMDRLADVVLLGELSELLPAVISPRNSRPVG